MTKEIRLIRDKKINEMINTISDFSKRSINEIEHGKFEILNIDGKEIKIYSDLVDITTKEIEYVKKNLYSIYLKICNMNRQDVLNRLTYMYKRVLFDSDFETRNSVSSTISAIKVYGKR